MIISGRFNGPPGSGNGGYSSGLVAAYVSGGSQGVEVTLRRPPPLDTELSVRQEHAVRVFDGSDLIAEAAVQPVSPAEAVLPVSFDEAVAASRSYPGFANHPFPTCFVCGPLRSDGLRLFPGRLPDGRVAAPFAVPDDISEVMVWACLDCPGGWAVPLEARPYVLGRIAVRVNGVPAPGDRCVVTGVMTSENGRKAYAGTTLYSSAGQVLAIARATWIAL